MRKSRGKPKRWEWALALGMMAAGLLLELPFVPEPLRGRLAAVLLPTGLVLFLILFWQKERFEDLPYEEQRELEREDRVDERSKMLRGRAAWLSWQVETAVLMGGLVAIAVFFEDFDLNMFRGLLMLWWLRLLLFEAFQWRMEKKY